jgi:hypothetical protein
VTRPLAVGSDTHRRKEDVEAIVARALQDPAAPPPPTVAVDTTALVEMASHHRVLLLLGSTLRAAGTLENWPAEFIDVFQRAERDAVAFECVRHAELVTVLAALSATGLRVVLFKGAALAYSRYPAPHVRARADTDLLVASSDVEALESVLQRLGYVRPAETSGRLVSYQSHYHKIDRYGVTHALDVHWRISNLQMLADRFTFEELWGRRIPLAALGSSAVTIDDVHALLLALLHRAGHHPGSRNLLWLYDLHVLASGLTHEQLSQVQEIASARGLGHIVADGLALARDRFGTGRVGSIIDALRARAQRQEDAIVVQGPWTQAEVLRLDLDALPSWRARGRLIFEHLAPSAGYMRVRYGVRSNLWLPALYLWRVLHGAPKWLRRHETD